MRSFDIALGPRSAGVLYERASGSAFLYANSFADDPKAPVLSQSLLDQNSAPLDATADGDLLPFFANLLPEPGPLRRYLAGRQGVDEGDDFALLAALGRNLPGAVLASPIDSGEAGFATPNTQPERLSEHWRFSLAGVQMKFSATREGDRWALASPEHPGDWIVKLPTTEYPGLIENEFAIMNFARACGLDVPETALVDLREVPDLDVRFLLPGYTAYAIRRYDRSEAGRIHQEDFCQVFNLPPAAKYGKDARRGAEDVLRVIQTLCSPDDVAGWIRALAFTIAVGNADAHLKNYALVYPDGRTPRPSPTYDVVCVLRYEHRARLALPVAGIDSFTELTPDTLDRLAHASGVSPRIVHRNFTAMEERLVQAWPEHRAYVADEDVRHIVEHGVTHRLRKLCRSTA